MKLTFGLTAALAGCAVAAQQAADVYILPTAASSASSSSTPSISRSLARLILLQRLAPAGKGPSISEIPDDSDIDNVVSMMNQFGKEPVSLFGQGAGSPSQLVVMLEGLTGEQMKDLGGTFNSNPAFTIADPPNSGAHDNLLKNDFYNVGITNEHKCSLQQVSNPFEEQCWSGKSTVAKYNVQKHPETLKDLARQAPRLAKLASSGEMETTVLLFPTVVDSAAKQWSSGPQELRRRQSEQVISAFDGTQKIEAAAPTSPTAADQIFHATRSKVPACFNSEESCMAATGNCSSHGGCRNKYAKAGGAQSKESCYVCKCLSTKAESGSVTHWAGPTCAKMDVSVPFWLFAGFTLLMIGVLSLSIGLLFSVGEEKMPGVLGAGVSRSK